MPEIELPGCTPEPLMNYLKALGVFRLVAEDREHGDPAARLSWSGGQAVLHSKFDREGLVKFFLEDYRPTPIVAPWNGGSGFYGGGAEPLEAIASSTTARLQLYRDTICTLRAIVPKQKPKDDDKQRLLTACRNELNDEVGGWLDSCFVLREDSTSFFLLLGTGGNDGRLDFTNNFFQRLGDVIAFVVDAAPTQSSRNYLNSALFADTVVSLGKSAIGQFNPGGIGGPNGTQGRFEADSRVNPWEFVLMIEGVLLFAGSVARRWGVGGSLKAAFPFTVESVAVGYGSAIANEETTDGSRAELWLPLWDAPASFAEVKHLFAEGRAQLSRHQARNAVEFALAVNLLGVNRGVTSFARYGFLKRNGLAFLATPLGRVPVTPRPKARLLEDPALSNWLERLRSACRDKDKTPSRYQTALRNIDRAIFQFANRSDSRDANDAKYLVAVLRSLGRAEKVLANGLRFCQEKNIQPLSGLSLDWLLLAQPSEEWRPFRLAAALASISREPQTELGPFRVHLEPVECYGSRARWWPGSTSAVWTNRPLVENLAAVLLRRAVEAEQNGKTGVPSRALIHASLRDLVVFLADDGSEDDDLTDLLYGLVGLDWVNSEWFKDEEKLRELHEAFDSADAALIPPEFAAIRLTTEPVRLVWASKESATVELTPDLRVHHQLVRGSQKGDSLVNAVRMAGYRLHADQFANHFSPARKMNADAKFNSVRLAAACLFPLSTASYAQLARTISDAGSLLD